MWRAELALLLRRVRIKALLVVLAAVPILVAVAVRIAGSGPDPGVGPRFLDQVTNNGVFAGLVGLTVTVPFFLPLAVAVVAGDSGGRRGGPGNAALPPRAPVWSHPPARGQGRSPLRSSVCWRGSPWPLPGSSPEPCSSRSGRSRRCRARRCRSPKASPASSAPSMVVGASLFGLAAIGMFISTLTDVPVGAMAATAGIAVLSGVLDAVPQVHALHPWLLTHWWLSFGDLLPRTDPVDRHLAQPRSAGGVRRHLRQRGVGAVQLQGRPGLIGGPKQRAWPPAARMDRCQSSPFRCGKAGRSTRSAGSCASCTDAFVRTCGGEASAVRVLIRDVPKTDWAVGGELVADRDEES